MPRADVARILRRMEGLRDDPRPSTSEKLSTQERYRLRQADYRILYSVDDAALMIEIVKIGHRRDVYR